MTSFYRGSFIEVPLYYIPCIYRLFTDQSRVKPKQIVVSHTYFPALPAPYAEIHPKPSPRMLQFLASPILSCAHSSDQRCDWLCRFSTWSLIRQILYYVLVFCFRFTNETCFVPADTNSLSSVRKFCTGKSGQQPVVKYVNKRVAERWNANDLCKARTLCNV